MRLEGRQIGRYHFERLIGTGGMGQVYLAVDPRIQQQVAIKVMQVEDSPFSSRNTEKEVARFRREANAIARLNHPYIVRLNDYDEAEVDGTKFTYIVTPFYQEGSLANWLRQRTSGPLSLQDIAHFVRQAADALQYAHTHQIIHQDVKPSNFLIDTEQNANWPDLLLTDFGISKSSSTTAYTGTQGSVGTLTYMAPEQINGQPTYASDQYALAVMTYELLTGRPPFEGPPQFVIRQHFETQPQPPSSLNPSLPRSIDNVILRALAKKPEDRFDSVAAFANAFQQGLPRGKKEPIMNAVLNGPFGRTTLGPTPLTIGRVPDNQLVLNNPETSSHHAEIRPEGQGYSIVDLGSTNGTFINGQPLERNVPRMLNPGDSIRIGDLTFTYEASRPPGIAPTVYAPPSQGDAPGYLPTVAAPPSTAYGNVNAPQSSQQPPPSPSYPDAAQSPVAPPPPQQPYSVPSQANRPPYTPTPAPSQPPYTPQLSGAQKPRSTARAIILAVVALVIILGGVSAFFVIHGQQVQQQNINATATAQSLANAKASATAQVTSHYSPFTTLALNDPLTSNSSSQWIEGGGCQFTSAGYQVSITQIGFFQPCLEKTPFSDFAYQITMTIQQGDCGGLVFRAVDPNDYYVIEVCQNGTYNAAIESNGQLTPSQNTPSTAIHRGLNQANVLAIVVQGNTFNLYINDSSKLVRIFTDNKFSQGTIGVLAEDNTNPTSVAYTNALVWTAS